MTIRFWRSVRVTAAVSLVPLIPHLAGGQIGSTAASIPRPYKKYFGK